LRDLIGGQVRSIIPQAALIVIGSCRKQFFMTCLDGRDAISCDEARSRVFRVFTMTDRCGDRNVRLTEICRAEGWINRTILLLIFSERFYSSETKEITWSHAWLPRISYPLNFIFPERERRNGPPMLSFQLVRISSSNASKCEAPSETRSRAAAMRKNNSRRQWRPENKQTISVAILSSNGDQIGSSEKERSAFIWSKLLAQSKDDVIRSSEVARRFEYFRGCSSASQAGTRAGTTSETSGYRWRSYRKVSDADRAVERIREVLEDFTLVAE